MPVKISYSGNLPSDEIHEVCGDQRDIMAIAWIRGFKPRSQCELRMLNCCDLI